MIKNLKKIKTLSLIIVLMFINTIISYADEDVYDYLEIDYSKEVEKSVAFDTMLKDIGVTNDKSDERTIKDARDDIMRQRMIFEPAGKQAMDQMLNPDIKDGSEGNGSSFGGGFFGSLPNFKKMNDELDPLVATLSSLKSGAKINPLAWDQLLKMDTDYNIDGIYDKYIMEAAQKYEIDPLMIKLIIVKESKGRPDIPITFDGGMGLMQVTNGATGEEREKLLHDPQHNIDVGTQILKGKIAIADSVEAKGATIRNVFKKYNGGGSAADDYGDDMATWYSAIRGIDAWTTNINDVNLMSLGGDTTYYTELQLANGKYVWPTPKNISIGSEFGMRMHPIKKVLKMHTGIDINGNLNHPIVAIANGTVVFSAPQDPNNLGEGGGYGNYVMIDHGSGLVTLYAHQPNLIVKVGDEVKKGQQIGLVGSTGDSTGPHLHFETRVNGTPVNPVGTGFEYEMPNN